MTSRAGSPRLAVVVNGAARDVPRGMSVAALVAELGVAPRHVAVERNGQVVPRAAHAATDLEEGDVLEIVTLVGGG